MGVEDRWTPEGEQFMKELRELAELEVRVGFQRDGKAEENGAELIDVAMWNEFGTEGRYGGEHIPSRPFMRDSVDKHIPAIEHALMSAGEGFLSGTPARQILRTIGLFQQDLMQTEIEQGDFIPNRPSTIQKKGSDKPLIDTGKMKNSIHPWIGKKGSDS